MKMRNEYPLLVSRARSVNRPAASITPRWCNSHVRVLIRVLHIEEKLKVFKYKEESSLPFPISDIRCPLMCVLQTRSPPACSWKSSERVGSVQLDWFAGAHFSAAALAGCLQCSEFSEPVWAAPAGGSGNWSLRFPQRVWFYFSLLLNNCLSVRITSSPADDECPADKIFSVSLLDLQVCLCYTDVFALTFHQFLPRTTLIIQR